MKQSELAGYNVKDGLNGLGKDLQTIIFREIAEGTGDQEDLRQYATSSKTQADAVQYIKDKKFDKYIQDGLFIGIVNNKKYKQEDIPSITRTLFNIFQERRNEMFLDFSPNGNAIVCDLLTTYIRNNPTAKIGSKEVLEGVVAAGFLKKKEDGAYEIVQSIFDKLPLYNKMILTDSLAFLLKSNGTYKDMPLVEKLTLDLAYFYKQTFVTQELTTDDNKLTIDEQWELFVRSIFFLNKTKASLLIEFRETMQRTIGLYTDLEPNLDALRNIPQNVKREIIGYIILQEIVLFNKPIHMDLTKYENLLEQEGLLDKKEKAFIEKASKEEERKNILMWVSEKALIKFIEEARKANRLYEAERLMNIYNIYNAL
ncbi:MAG: hypothetical protein IJT36_08105 [Alphaproteobacteria bacterium]|nr:hypothetical protein [Alphaproteobacteria bacterium]